MVNFLKNFKLYPLKYKINKEEIEKNIDEIPDGNSQDENFLYYRSSEKIKIYDRICDHNGGRLSIREGGARCPLHGWEFDLQSGTYVNTMCSKKPLFEINEYELDSPLISIPLNTYHIETENWCSEKTTEIRYINHACLLIRIDELTFATDPWIYGSAFSNGWWLAQPSPNDAFDVLNECDFIYISHNHPDHLNEESLQKIRKDMPILTADFQSGSTKEYLHKLGFMNVFAMDMSSSLIDYKKQIHISVLKSGDFRDDSGLFFQHGSFKCLLTVDSNFINFGKLPRVDLLCASFAGGASGYPLCFENYSEEEKNIILTRNRTSIKATNLSNLKITEASFFMPYAGFFTEAAKRDCYIKTKNIKNTVEDFENICNSYKVNLLNVNKEQIFIFRGSSLVLRKKDLANKMDDSNLGEIKEVFADSIVPHLKEVVIEYFRGCKYNDNLLVDLRPTCDEFKSDIFAFRLDFSLNEYSIFDCKIHDESIKNEASRKGLRYLQIKVRRDELLSVLLNGKPWEDLIIGFQCRIYRNPNIYNSSFWYYFTNIYIGNNVVKLQAFSSLK